MRLRTFTATSVAAPFTGVARRIRSRVTNLAEPCHRHRDASRGVEHRQTYTHHWYLLSQTEIKIMREYACVYTAGVSAALCDISPSINPFCMMMHEARSANVARERSSGCGRDKRCPYKSFRQRIVKSWLSEHFNDSTRLDI